MLICYTELNTKNKILQKLKYIELTKSESKWINEMLKTPRFIEEHKLLELKRDYDIEIAVLEYFEMNRFCNDKVKDIKQRYLISKNGVEKRINEFINYSKGNANLKVDYENKTLYYDNLVIDWDDSKYYINGKLIAYINLSFERFSQILNRYKEVNKCSTQKKK